MYVCEPVAASMGSQWQWAEGLLFAVCRGPNWGRAEKSSQAHLAAACGGVTPCVSGLVANTRQLEIPH